MMRLPRGAISFLLAEYKAVFRRSYFKGLALAAGLTAGLAAGSAQAESLSDVGNLPSGGDVVTVTGEESGIEEVAIRSGSTASFDGTLNINSGNAWNGVSGNRIHSYLGVVDITGSGTININSGAGLVIRVGYSGPTVNVDIGEINVNEGTLNVQNYAYLEYGPGSLTLAADTITVGSGTADSSATMNIKTSPSGGNDVGLTIGRGEDNATIFTIKEGGTVKINSASEDGTITFLGQALNIEGGSLEVSGSYNSIQTEGGEWTEGSVAIKSGSSLEIALASDGTLNDSVLNVTGGTISLESGATIDIAAGTLNIGSTVDLAVSGADASAGIVVDGGADDFSGSDDLVDDKLSTLQIDGDVLANFLNADPEDETSQGQGYVLLQSGGILSFGSQAVDLTDYQWSGGEAAGGYIVVADTGLVTGNALTVSEALSDIGSNKLYIEADTLTLGSEDYSGTGSLGFEQATAQDNLILAGSSGSFTLMDNVVLSRSDDQSGSISGAELVISSADNEHGSLTIAEGTYTATADITMANGGYLYVGGSGATGDAALIVKSELDATSSGTSAQIRVYGSETGTATLDLTGATLTMAGTGNARLTASGSDATNTGTAIINSDQFKQITSQSNPGLKVAIESYGVLQVEGDLDNDGEVYSTGIFSNADQTYPAVGTIALGANSLVDINGSATFVGDLDLQYEDATLKVDGLTLNKYNEDGSDADTATIVQGIVGTSSDIKSNADTLAVGASGSGVTLILNGEGGEVVPNLTLDTNGELDVLAGDWILHDLDVSNSASGATFGEETTEDNDPDTTTVTLDKITATNSSITVNDTAEVTTAELDAASSKITVTGYFEVTGSDEDDAENCGVNLSGANITVSNNEGSLVGGNFVIGQTAATGLITQESGAGSLKVDDALTAASVTVAAWATYTVSLTDEYLLNKDDVSALKAGLGTDFKLQGTLSVGDAKLAIEGLDDDDEFIAWSKYEDFASIHSDVTSDKLKTKTLVIDKCAPNCENEAQGSVGAILIEDENPTAAPDETEYFLNIVGSTSLWDAYEGYCVTTATWIDDPSDPDGFTDVNVTVKDVTVNVVDDAVFTLANGGRIGPINLQEDSTLIVMTEEGSSTTVVNGGISGELFDEEGEQDGVDGEVDVLADTTLQVNGDVKVADMTVYGGNW